MEDSFILKIGGSILYDSELNINFELLNKVKDWYGASKSRYRKIVITTGGGDLSRMLQRKVSTNISNTKSLHEIAMSVTQTSANLVGGFLNDENVYIPKTLGDAYEYLMQEGVGTLVSGGLKVGWSTDMDAVIFADILSQKKVIKISDVMYLYDSDPNENSEARAIRNISWEEYFTQFSITDNDAHQPNLSIPIDKGCARFCRNKGISVFLCGGDNLKSEETLLDIFTDGTLIHP